jgi:hypothetical protein
MCSLKEAFETFSTQGAEEPGLGMFAAPLYSADLGMGQDAVNRERKKRRRRRLLPPEPAIVDPDRPANRPLPAAEELSETKAALTEPFDSSLLTAPMTPVPAGIEDTIISSPRSISSLSNDNTACLPPRNSVASQPIASG